MEDKYKIKIVAREGQGDDYDDYHATVTRISDGAELIWIATFKWFLKYKLRRANLDRAFFHYDRRKAKLLKTEEFTR
jgi:hypothetical protein